LKKQLTLKKSKYWIDSELKKNEDTSKKKAKVISLQMVLWKAMLKLKVSVLEITRVIDYSVATPLHLEFRKQLEIAILLQLVLVLVIPNVLVLEIVKKLAIKISILLQVEKPTALVLEKVNLLAMAFRFLQENWKVLVLENVKMLGLVLLSLWEIWTVLVLRRLMGFENRLLTGICLAMVFR
jgi:hypothetical protein